MKKKINKVIVISCLIFIFFFVRAIQNVRSAPKFVPGGQKEAPAAPSKSVSALPPFQDFSVFEKVKNGNYFLSALEAKTAAGGAAGGAVGTEPPPLAENEVREKDTGITYRFLGTTSEAGLVSALFMKSDPQKKDEQKCLSLQKGNKLGEQMKIGDVGGDWVKIQNGADAVELKVFAMEIRTLSAPGTQTAGAQPAENKSRQGVNLAERLKKRMEQRGGRMKENFSPPQRTGAGPGERGGFQTESSGQLGSQGQTENQGQQLAGQSPDRGGRRGEAAAKRGMTRKK